ncbi:MAG: DUF3426 domain-containing protein [Chloroflexi bacterium]|nr:DUF3426 domain-containing protein [Chloroflexota bacterium]
MVVRPLFRLLALALAIPLGIALAACAPRSTGGEPSAQMATPIPPDSGFVTYRHPTGVFNLRTPPGWIAGDLPDRSGVRVQFTTVEEGEAVARLSVYIVNTGQPMTPEAFAQAANAYQPPADLASFAWEQRDRTDLPDGSRRLTGVRTYPTLGPRALNIFLQGSGTFFSALELDITGANTEQLATLQTVVNTFTVNANAELAIGTVQQAAAGVTSSSGVIAFNGTLDWSDPDGSFHLTGEAINTGYYPLEAIRLSGVLFDAQGRRLAEQSDILAVDVLAPGQAAPFDLRFEGGRPANFVRYELHAAAREADFLLASFYGPENFTIANDEALYSAQQRLVIRGQIANTGPSIAEQVKVIVTIWDDAGRVVGAETLFLAQSRLVPQEAASFEVPFFALGGPAMSYTLIPVGTIASSSP